ncbi:putative membrane protein [Synechococcus sp. PCC 7502]|uniref:NnrU family protein n=1 Tax=Synechococcus sp. PCC 7502 TaxID=1173263 RepID=UPI00029FC878|nr:NnrU family protein [Synechococcus sp. PCC 7502]AFY72218.1 putative membrane protein [Synechococcus sp. PCC 7502]
MPFSLNFLSDLISEYSSHLIMLGLILGFAIAHSGLAALRAKAETKIGARAYRVIFALVSLTLATVMLIYFFNHRYDGVILWNVQDVTGIKTLVSVVSVISFIFLYPATFNLLEIAAIQKPQVHLYETGIIRISRHPQMVGQVIWCIAHTLWIGSSFMIVASTGLILHHLFGVWHGDRRLEQRFGAAFLEIKNRTSVIPFLAVWQGKQEIQWQEFLRPAYIGVLIAVVAFRLLHPVAIAGAAQINW